METFKKRWRTIPTIIRKPIVFTLGSIIVLTGIILLPLPGPGWAIIFIGFAILATEFTIAERVRAWLVDRLKTLILWGKNLFRKNKH